MPRLLVVWTDGKCTDGRLAVKLNAHCISWGDCCIRSQIKKKKLIMYVLYTPSVCEFPLQQFES